MMYTRFFSALIGLFLFSSSAFGQSCKTLEDLPKTEPVITEITKEQFDGMTPPRGAWSQMTGINNCIDGVLFKRELNSVEFRTLTPEDVSPKIFFRCVEIYTQRKAKYWLYLYVLGL